MKEKKYIEFLETMDFYNGRQRYIKNVKYRVVDETDDKYILSKRRDISLSKSKEGVQFITGKI